MTVLSVDHFDSFFRSVNNRFPPFKWQVRLLRELVVSGSWPEVIDSPTGTGKSSVIDVHLFANALASQEDAGMAPLGLRLPRRLVVTVDRRALVDGHWQHASRLQAKLIEACPDDGVLWLTAQALRRVDYQAEGQHDHDLPFHVYRVRGGEVPDRRWVDRPAACQIVAATPDMIGSRVLFQGYGTTRMARSREAGLLAWDTVVVVDEAHMNRQLTKTLGRVRELNEPHVENIGVAPMGVVRMTATPSDASQRMVGVRPDDLDGSDELLTSRLQRPKPLTLVPMLPQSGRKSDPLKDQEIVNAIAAQTISLVNDVRRDASVDAPQTVGCIVNTVPRALHVAALLRKWLRSSADHDFESMGELDSLSQSEVVMLAGRMRPYDFAIQQQTHPGLFNLHGDPRVAVVVATQTIEVGVDMDFAGLVTELAPGSAIAQRAGRVNRSGKHSQAQIKVLYAANSRNAPQQFGPYHQSELSDSLDWLKKCEGNCDGLSAWRIHPQGGGLVPPPAKQLRPVLQRVEAWEVDEWARTSDSLASEPWLDLWLSDQLEEDLTVGFVVRAGLPSDNDMARQQVIASSPLVDEVFPVRISHVGRILGRLPGKRTLVSRGDEVLVTEEEALCSFVPQAGDIYVVDSLKGLVAENIVTDEGGGQKEPEDVGEMCQMSKPRVRWVRLGMRTPLGRSLARLANQDFRQLMEDLWSLVQSTEGMEEPEGRILAALQERVCQWVTEPYTDGRIRVLLELLRAGHALDVTYPDVRSVDEFWVVIRGKAATNDDDFFQTHSSGRVGVLLAPHQDAVAAEVAQLSQRLRLSEAVSRALEAAGLHHDDGKKDARFQYQLQSDSVDTAGGHLAKSGRRSRAGAIRALRASGLPRGWRHEQLSAALCWQALLDCEPDYRDLVVRLVGTSHGRGRHEFPHVGRELVPEGQDGSEASVELFDEAEWERVLRRTDERFGPWGCAYLESLLRAADGAVSGRGS